MEYKGFTALSEDREFAQAFVDDDGQGWLLVVVSPQTARDISELSQFQKLESEWLTPRGAQYRVLKVDRQGRRIELMELPPDQRQAVPPENSFSEARHGMSDAEWEAMGREMAQRRADIAAGRIKPKKLTRTQRLLQLHMQYA